MTDPVRNIELSTHNLHFHDNASIFSIDYDGITLLTAGGDATINQWKIVFKPIVPRKENIDALSLIEQTDTKLCKDIKIDSQNGFSNHDIKLPHKSINEFVSPHYQCYGQSRKELEEEGSLDIYKSVDTYKNEIRASDERSLYIKMMDLNRDRDIENTQESKYIYQNTAMKCSDKIIENIKNNEFDLFCCNHTDDFVGNTGEIAVEELQSLESISIQAYSTTDNNEESHCNAPTTILSSENNSIISDFKRKQQDDYSMTGKIPYSEKNATHNPLNPKYEQLKPENDSLSLFERHNDLDKSANYISSENFRNKIIPPSKNFLSGNNIKTIKHSHKSLDNNKKQRISLGQSTSPLEIQISKRNSLNQQIQKNVLDVKEILENVKSEFPVDKQNMVSEYSQHPYPHENLDPNLHQYEKENVSVNNQTKQTDPDSNMIISKENGSFDDQTKQTDPDSNMITAKDSKSFSKFLYDQNINETSDSSKLNLETINFIRNQVPRTSIKFKFIQTFSKHTKHINCVRYYGNNHIFASCSDGGEVYIWKNNTPTAVRRPDGDDAHVLVWGDGLLFVGFSSGKISVYSVIEYSDDTGTRQFNTNVDIQNETLNLLSNVDFNDSKTDANIQSSNINNSVAKEMFEPDKKVPSHTLEKKFDAVFLDSDNIVQENTLGSISNVPFHQIHVKTKENLCLNSAIGSLPNNQKIDPISLETPKHRNKLMNSQIESTEFQNFEGYTDFNKETFYPEKCSWNKLQIGINCVKMTSSKDEPVPRKGDPSDGSRSKVSLKNFSSGKHQILGEKSKNINMSTPFCKDRTVDNFLLKTSDLYSNPQLRRFIDSPENIEKQNTHTIRSYCDGITRKIRLSTYFRQSHPFLHQYIFYTLNCLSDIISTETNVQIDEIYKEIYALADPTNSDQCLFYFSHFEKKSPYERNPTIEDKENSILNIKFTQILLISSIIDSILNFFQHIILKNFDLSEFYSNPLRFVIQKLRPIKNFYNKNFYNSLYNLLFEFRWGCNGQTSFNDTNFYGDLNFLQNFRKYSRCNIKKGVILKFHKIFLNILQKIRKTSEDCCETAKYKKLSAFKFFKKLLIANLQSFFYLPTAYFKFTPESETNTNFKVNKIQSQYLPSFDSSFYDDLRKFVQFSNKKVTFFPALSGSDFRDICIYLITNGLFQNYLNPKHRLRKENYRDNKTNLSSSHCRLFSKNCNSDRLDDFASAINHLCDNKLHNQKSPVLLTNSHIPEIAQQNNKQDFEPAQNKILVSQDETELKQASIKSTLTGRLSPSTLAVPEKQDNNKRNLTDSNHPFPKRRAISVIPIHKLFEITCLCSIKAHQDAIQGLCFSKKHNVLATISKDGSLKTFAFIHNRFQQIDKITTYEETQMSLTGFTVALFFARPEFSQCGNFLFVPNCKENNENFVYILHYPFRRIDMYAKIGPLRSTCIKILQYLETIVLVCKNDIYISRDGFFEFTVKNIAFYQLTDAFLFSNTVFCSSLEGFIYTLRLP